MTKKTTSKTSTSRKTTSKQIIAIIGIALLAAMYLFTLIAALLDNADTMLLFRASLIATFAIPLLIWVYIFLYGKLTGKHTMADFDLGNEDSAEEQE